MKKPPPRDPAFFRKLANQQYATARFALEMARHPCHALSRGDVFANLRLFLAAREEARDARARAVALEARS